jgi:hypothetical protein
MPRTASQYDCAVIEALEPSVITFQAFLTGAVITAEATSPPGLPALSPYRPTRTLVAVVSVVR